MTTMAFRDALLAYIGQEKDLAEAESDRRKSLTRDEKIGEGLLLPDLAIVSSAGGPDNHEYGFRLGGDRMRLRVGEVVSIRPSAAAGGTAACGFGSSLRSSFRMPRIRSCMKPSLPMSCACRWANSSGRS